MAPPGGLGASPIRRSRPPAPLSSLLFVATFSPTRRRGAPFESSNRSPQIEKPSNVILKGFSASGSPRRRRILMISGISSDITSSVTHTYCLRQKVLATQAEIKIKGRIFMRPFNFGSPRRTRTSDTVVTI